MSDNLRYRIAAAIYDASDEYARKLMVRPDCPGASELEGDSKPVCYTLADAVIRELGLRREDLGGFRVPGYGHRGYRYVTDWIAEQTIRRQSRPQEARSRWGRVTNLMEQHI